MQGAPSGEVQWYVFKNEQTFGPLRFSDLVQFAKQHRLLKDDWVWRPGIDTWIAAGYVSGLFPAPLQIRNQQAQINGTIEAGEGDIRREHKPTLKKKVVEETKSFLTMFVYLWIVFGLLAVHESLVLSQHQITYQSHGLAVVNALVFAKVMLIADELKLGNRLNDKPLIYSILFKSLLFAIALICFHIAEHVLIGLWHGMAIDESISEVGAKKLKTIVSAGMIATIALIPFFAFREIGSVLGEHKFLSLIFKHKTKADKIASKLEKVQEKEFS